MMKMTNSHCVLVLCTLALLLHSALSACRENHLLDSDYRQMYCDADIVFRGSPSMAMSSIGIDLDGRQVQGSVHTFNVQHWFYGDQPDSHAIGVHRTWREADPCDAASFPDQAASASFLVFASRTGSAYSVETCRHSFPWECLPDSFRSSLPIVC